MTSAHTATPTVHAVRKQPSRKTASAPTPPRSASKPKAVRARPASRAKTTTPRKTPISQEPIVRWRTPMGARNWCFIDLLHTSKRTAYATSSWQTCTVERAIVPVRMKAASAGLRVKKRERRPMDRRPTTGQKASSKTKKTLRDAMRMLRRAKAHTAASSARQLTLSCPAARRASSSETVLPLSAPAQRCPSAQRASSTLSFRSARQLNEDLLQVGLAHLQVADDHAVAVEEPQELRQPLLGRVHRA